MAVHLLRLAVVAAIALALIVLVAALAWSRRRGTARRVDAIDLPGGLHAPLTVVYFTSRYCTECQDIPAIVLSAAPELPAVALNVSERPLLARKYRLTQTPTILVVDPKGSVHYTAVGPLDPDALWQGIRGAWDRVVLGRPDRRRTASHAAAQVDLQ